MVITTPASAHRIEMAYAKNLDGRGTTEPFVPFDLALTNLRYNRPSYFLAYLSG